MAQRRLPHRVWAPLAALALTFSLGSSPVGALAPEVAPGVTATPAVHAQRLDGNRVLAISIDGLNPAAIKRLGRDGAPAFYRLLDQGAATLNARTEVEQTVTLPNHTSMMTGRRVDARLGGHGVTWDDDRPGSTVQAAAGHPVASIFTSVHDAGGSTALFAAKTKFSLYQRSWPTGIDEYAVDMDNTRLVAAARSDLKKRDRAFTFLHLSLPDVAGHASGFMSPTYVDAVRQTDVLLGRILRAIDQSPELSADLTVVLTADHGGKGAGHSDAGKLADYRIPFVVWGAGVTAGDLYAANPTYANPRQRQVGYTGAQPIRNGDVANLAADLLGLGPVPGSLMDAAQTLSVG